MGIAIIIPDIDFDINLGKVTIEGDQPSFIGITGLSIVSKPSTIQDSVQLSVSYTPSNTTQKGVTWQSSDEMIATVSSSGYVTVKKSGNVTITAISTYKTQLSDSFTASCSISQIHIPITSISVEGDTTGNVGGTIQLSASVLPSNASNKNVTWQSDNTNVAEVNTNGLVTLKASGTVTISATSVSETDISGSLTITVASVVIPVESVSVSGGSSGEVGGNIQLSATVLPGNASNKSVSWRSSNTDIATVNSSGLVTLKAIGDVVITAISSYDNNITDTHSIVISETSVIVGAKTIISFTRLTEGIDYDDVNGENINVVFPNGKNGGSNFPIKTSNNGSFGTLVHDITQYPSGTYTWKAFGFLNNTLSGNQGVYPDKYFVRAAYLSNAATPTRGLMFLRDVANGNYKIKIYVCTPAENAYDSSKWNNIVYQINDSSPINLSFNTGNNVNDYIEINATVTDGTMSIMAYSNTTGLYSAPALCIVEITKL